MRKVWTVVGTAFVVAFAMSAMFVGFSQAADTCVTDKCHAQMGKAKYIHGPVGVGQCTVCHVEAKKGHHTGKKPDFQLVATGKALCERCHQPVDKFEFKHTPVKKGECGYLFALYPRRRTVSRRFPEVPPGRGSFSLASFAALW